MAYPLGALLLPVALVLDGVLEPGLGRWLVYLGGVWMLGLADDLLADEGSPRGLRGHGVAVLGGRPSTGALKAAGTITLALYATSGLAQGPEQLATVGVLVLATHLGNILDLRPGRAEKALWLVLAAVCAAGTTLAPLELLAPFVVVISAGAWLTLRERAMLGDSGASLIGAVMGVALVTTLEPVATYATFAGLIAISLYGEFRSITVAMGRVPLLERLDSIGRGN